MALLEIILLWNFSKAFYAYKGIPIALYVELKEQTSWEKVLWSRLFYLSFKLFLHLIIIRQQSRKWLTEQQQHQQ